MRFATKMLSSDLCVWQNGKAEDGAEEEEVLDEETKKRDQIVKGAIDGLIREYSSELNAQSQDDESSRRKKRREKKDEVGCSLSCPFYSLKFCRLFDVHVRVALIGGQFFIFFGNVNLSPPHLFLH